MSYLTGVFPVLASGRNIGSVTISQEGLLTAFECLCTHDGAIENDPSRVPRLAAVCAGSFVPLGVMIPQGSSLRLKKKFSKSGLQSIGYCDTDTFVLVTKAELEAVQSAAAPTVPPENEPKTPEIDAPPIQPAPPVSTPEQIEAEEEKSAPLQAVCDDVKDEISSLNLSSIYAASDSPPDNSNTGNIGFVYEFLDISSNSSNSEQSQEQIQDIPVDESEPLSKADAAAPEEEASENAPIGQDLLNDSSKLMEALAPALSTILSALNAQKPPPEAAGEHAEPDVQPDSPPQSDVQADSMPQSSDANIDEDADLKPRTDSIAKASVENDASDEPEEDDTADESDGDTPMSEALGKPLIGGWRPAPPLSLLFEDASIYEERESVADALVTEQDGFTLLAVPVSPDDPFALMSIFCFGYPTQIADKDYILFKIHDGTLAL